MINYYDSLLGIDYQHLHQINTILSRCDLCWQLSFTATLQFITPPNSTAQLSLPDYYSVKVRVDSEHVIDALVDNKEFAVAYDYAKIVGAGSDVISVREVSILQNDTVIPLHSDIHGDIQSGTVTYTMTVTHKTIYTVTVIHMVTYRMTQ